MWGIGTELYDGNGHDKECKNEVIVLRNTGEGESQNQKGAVKFNLRGKVTGGLPLLLPSKIRGKIWKWQEIRFD